MLPGKSTGTRKAFFKNEMSSAKPHFWIFVLIFGVFSVLQKLLQTCTVASQLPGTFIQQRPSKSYQLVEAKFRIVCTVGTLAGELRSTDESKWLKKLAELLADPFFAPQRPLEK